MQLGLIGLGTMGANLARNAARNGAKVAVFNRTTETMEKFMEEFGSEGDFVGCKDYSEMVQALDAPRAIVLMVKAGPAVDAVVADLLPHLEKGDIIIDAGNSLYHDTNRREKELLEKGFHFVGMGVSGGEEGALHGPSMMPGGDEKVVKGLMPLLEKMAADDSHGGKCVAYMGPGGAGHFVKMVHNGIEYGIMQLLAESYDLLKRDQGLSNAEIAKVYKEWSESDELNSFLMEITAEIFTKKDTESDADLIDVILDAAGQKGTGKWTTDAALNYGVSIPTITASIDARIISSGKDFRRKQSAETPLSVLEEKKNVTVDDIKIALELSILNSYGQGFQLLSVGGAEEGWQLNLSEIARIWLGGCIIRSTMLDPFRTSFTGDKNAIAYLTDRLSPEHQKQWRHVVSTGALCGIPLPAMSASLWYYDSYRTERLPQNLIQAQRDFFGAHTYQRIDKEGVFHTEWS